MTHHIASTERTRVVIVGAGFGGLAAAEHLAHLPVDFTLVDTHDYHTFQPLLYQVATSLLNAEDVGRPVRDMFHHQENLTFRQATATGADWEAHHLQLAEGDALPFDYLVLAAGATANYFGIPGAATYALPLYTLPDAVRLRNQILDRFEAADRDPALVDDGASHLRGCGRWANRRRDGRRAGGSLPPCATPGLRRPRCEQSTDGAGRAG